MRPNRAYFVSFEWQNQNSFTSSGNLAFSFERNCSQAFINDELRNRRLWIVWCVGFLIVKTNWVVSQTDSDGRWESVSNEWTHNNQRTWWIDNEFEKYDYKTMKTKRRVINNWVRGFINSVWPVKCWTYKRTEDERSKFKQNDRTNIKWTRQTRWWLC